MHIRNNFTSINCFQHSGSWVRYLCVVLAAFGVVAGFSVTASRADVVIVGDSSPPYDPDDPNGSSVGDAGGPVPGGILIIGDTGVGGMFIDIAPPFIGTLQPLQSLVGIVGNGENAIGSVVMDDFSIAWHVASTLVVGSEGQGTLDIFDSALMRVGGPLPPSGPPLGGETILGELPTGNGRITLNGLASRLTTGDLIVGQEGFGDLEANDRASFISVDSFIGREDGSDGHVLLTGTGTRWDLRGVLTIADNGDPNSGGFANAKGRLTIEDNALLQARSISGDSAINVGELGFIDLSGGTIRQLDIDSSGGSLTALPILNGGVIRGDGFVDAAVTITPTGEIRNAAATANEREYLLVSGPVTNDGTIESLGGEMEFESAVTNNFEIIARDAVIRVPGGIMNDSGGIVILGGETTIHGTIDSSGGGTIVTLPNSDILVASDIIFSSSVGSLTAAIGDSSSTLTIAGTATLDGFLVLNYSGAPSVPGDSYDILFATGGIFGTFDNFMNRAIADNRLWDIINSGNVLTVTATGTPTMAMGADFNGDGIVDSQDLAIWEMNYPIGSGAMQTMGDADGDGDVDGSDFLKIQMDLGGPPSLMAAVAAVPEPSALLLALSALAFGFRRRVA